MVYENWVEGEEGEGEGGEGRGLKERRSGIIEIVWKTSSSVMSDI
jgi:hypothetical protein